MEPALRVCSVHSYKAVPDTTDFCLHQVILLVMVGDAEVLTPFAAASCTSFRSCPSRISSTESFCMHRVLEATGTSVRFSERWPVAASSTCRPVVLTYHPGFPEYIEMGWGKNTSGTPRQQLVDRSLTQMHRKAIKRKCVLDLVEDALVNPIKCVWDDYQKGPSARLPFPNPPQCIWSSL